MVRSPRDVNLNAVTEVVRPLSREEAARWRDGDVRMDGRTRLYSEPMPDLRRLVNLERFGWEPLKISHHGLEIASTCTIARLDTLAAPADWIAAPLIRLCCSLLASFKIWNTATVGGNICLSFPAGAMISLTAALEGVYGIWLGEGGHRYARAEEFVTGNHTNILRPGGLLRSIFLPTSALRKHACFRHMTLTHDGRSSVLLIGTLCRETGAFAVSITAATTKPVRLEFPSLPDAKELQTRIQEGIPVRFTLQTRRQRRHTANA